jgi:hypothetical protein
MSPKSSSIMVAKSKSFSLNLKKMGYDRKQLNELMKPLYGFDGKRIEPVRVITLLISFGTL